VVYQQDASLICSLVRDKKERKKENKNQRSAFQKCFYQNFKHFSQQENKAERIMHLL
jgi:hypothetical protein